MPNVPPLPTDPEATVGFRLGELRVEPDTGKISGPAGKEQVDPKVMAVLVALAGNPGELLTRTQLLEGIWPGGDIYDDVLTQCVYQLRQHLSAAGGSSKYRNLIETLPKRGYLLRCKVLPLEPTPAPRPATAHPITWRTASLLALLLLVIGSWLLQHRDLPATPANSAVGPVSNPIPNSIAVLL